jgi:hypothetical protein
MGWGKIAHTIGVPPSGQAGAQARSHTSPGVVTAAGAGRATASSRSDGPGRSGIVTAANGRPAATPDLARGHGNAFGHASPGVQSGMGPGGNAFGHGRAGK